MDTGISPALRLLTLLWHEKCVAVDHTWERVYDTMRRGLHLAISAGLSFHEDDFTHLAAVFKWGHWCGMDNDRNYGEQFYTAAVVAGHLQACRAMEKYYGRTPFYVHGKRLRLGSAFAWDGTTVYVTSFDDEQHTLIACAYDKLGWSSVLPYGISHEREQRGDGKPRKRYTITATMLTMLSRLQRQAAGAKEKEA